ncbi:hypothetical protein [Anaerovorax sp. IOR16]|uniref:hypothetical protein n=1 Tax=Anaerovorax sp. IOR16 TaxID=2773458 RepID=UPI0019D29F6A|nr:hypothetical protein [Anaerovorax sp. IOR16]
MNIKLETYLEQHKNWSSDEQIEIEIKLLQKRANRICVALENYTLTTEQADKKYKPIALKLAGLHQIQRERNKQKCMIIDGLVGYLNESFKINA